MRTLQDLKLEYKQETGLEPVVTAYGFRPYLTWLEEKLIRQMNKEIEEPKHPTSWRDFTMTDGEEHSDSSSPDYDSINVTFPKGKTTHIGTLIPIEPKQTAGLRELISNAFTENSSDANNGQMSVITEDSYSDLIDEIIEIFQQERAIRVTDEEIEKYANYWFLGYDGIIGINKKYSR